MTHDSPSDPDGRDDPESQPQPAGSDPAGVCYLSASRVAAAIRDGEISSEEATGAVLRQIDKVNPAVNAVVTVLRDAALAHARAADAARARHESRGVLHGVPFTVKDTFETAGVRTTAGAVALRDYVPPTDATVVARLLQAGAVLVGKTNTPALGVDWQTYNDVFGTTNNPRDLTRTPGGSSGGCAAAVAAGMSYLSVGSDFGGSIRIPAAFCGVYGHKPSRGLVHSEGHIPPLPGTARSGSSPGVRGPLARSAADLRLALAVLGGPGEGGGARPPTPPRREKLPEYRVGFVLNDPLCPVCPELGTVFARLVKDLGDAGVALRPGWPDGLVPEDQFKLYQCLALARKVYNSPGGEKGRRFAALVRELTGEAPAATRAGLKAQLSAAERGLNTARRAWHRYFETHDVFLLPAAFLPAFPHDHSVPLEQRRLETLQGPRPYLDLPFWSCFATVAGLPATVAPVGLSPARGLPVGVQIVGRYLQDAATIDFAEALEELSGGFKAPLPTEAPSPAAVNVSDS